MIQKIGLKNFKCFKDRTEFPIAVINLLTGINGCGKSTVLQSLLLFRQTIEHDKTSSKLFLNGSCLNLGTYNDVKNSNTSGSEEILISFDIQDSVDNIDPVTYEFHFIADSEDESVLLPINLENIQNSDFDAKHKPYENLPLRRIHYVSADRLGPQDYYKKHNLGDFVQVGKEGELTASVLHRNKTQLVHDNLYLSEVKVGEEIIADIDQTLETQVGYWIGEVLGIYNTKLLIESPRAGLVILLFRFGNVEMAYKPANVGFGFSYILPIIVSGLIAQKGDILIVENPEAHLHPRAQSLLTQFLSRVASCGVQVFIESHSEHILNALRVVVKSEKFGLSSSEINVLYFQRSQDEYFVQIPIEEDGGINFWPEGFFDQTDEDFKLIFGF